MTTSTTKYNIQTAITRFADGDLTANALHLFQTLGYNTNRTSPLDDKTYAGFASLFGRLPNEENGLVNDWRSVDLLFQITAAEIDHVRGGRVDNTIIESYLFFAIELKEAAYSRTKLSHITREINRVFPMPAMILFKYGSQLTLSIIHRRLHKRDDSKDVLEIKKVTQIKDIHITTPHRAHIDILFDLSLDELRRTHTVTNFVELHAAWQDVLSTSQLNKQFFRRIADWFFWAKDRVKFPIDDYQLKAENGDKTEAELQDIANQLGLIRLLTRLIFVWFIKEKGLIPDSIFQREKVDNLIDVDKDPRQSAYYKAILQNLFFATLNQEMTNRAHSKATPATHMALNLYRYRDAFKPGVDAIAIFKDVPFLNGGLFECLDYEILKDGKQEKRVRIDWFSDHRDNDLTVPDELFFGPEQEADLNAVYATSNKRYKVAGLLHILDAYKFTIAENTPIEEEIALDPELLGKVFENLLAYYNPETATTARKQTGSFYTPREIVNYMVDESLIAYLQNSPFEGGVLSESKGGQGDVIEAKLRQLLSYDSDENPFDAADTERLIQAIDNLKILDPACGSGAFPMGILHKMVHILHKLDPQNKGWKDRQIDKAEAIDDADIRERAVQDIEQAFANNELDFGRKLYLIQNGIYGVDIQPIAVEISKLRFFISLIVDQIVDNGKPNRNISALPNLETKFVAANTLIGLEKPQAQGDLFGDSLKPLEEKLRKVKERYFSARTRAAKLKCQDDDTEIRRQISEKLQTERGLPPTTAEQLAHWDPYDHNASAPWFDPEWMFGVTGGFDVVIGNPPYALLQNIALDKSITGFLLKTYQVAQYKVDLFHLFIEKGTLLLKLNGVLSFITPNTFLKNKFNNQLRKFIFENMDFISVVIFYISVFDSASVDNLVFVMQKRRPTNAFIKTFEVTSDSTDLFKEVKLIDKKTINSPDFVFNFDVDSNISSILAKLESGTIKIRDIGRAYFGIQTFDRDKYVSTHKIYDFYKPVIDGGNINRYSISPPSEYVCFKKSAIKSGGNPSVYLEDRIVVRQIGRHPEGSICGAGIYTLNTIYNINIFDKKFSVKFILSIINSKLIKLFWLSNFYDNKKTFPKIKKAPLESIPIKIVDAFHQKPLIEKVDQILAHTQSDDYLANPAKQAAVHALEREIDHLVYHLYGLTEEEIAIVEGKT